jgi:hypothetical protein
MQASDDGLGKLSGRTAVNDSNLGPAIPLENLTRSTARSWVFKGEKNAAQGQPRAKSKG